MWGPGLYKSVSPSGGVWYLCARGMATPVCTTKLCLCNKYVNYCMLCYWLVPPPCPQAHHHHRSPCLVTHIVAVLLYVTSSCHPIVNRPDLSPSGCHYPGRVTRIRVGESPRCVVAVRRWSWSGWSWTWKHAVSSIVVVSVIDWWRTVTSPGLELKLRVLWSSPLSIVPVIVVVCITCSWEVLIWVPMCCDVLRSLRRSRRCCGEPERVTAFPGPVTFPYRRPHTHHASPWRKPTSRSTMRRADAMTTTTASPTTTTTTLPPRLTKTTRLDDTTTAIARRFAPTTQSLEQRRQRSKPRRRRTTTHNERETTTTTMATTVNEDNNNMWRSWSLEDAEANGEDNDQRAGITRSRLH